MAITFRLRKLNAIILKMQDADIDEKSALKRRYCDEVVSLIDDITSKSELVGNSIATVYLDDVKNGNYIKAVDCVEYVESINI